MNNDKISELYKNIEAQDKIINTQALEIARLRDENLEIARLRPLVDLLKEENNGVRKSFNDLQQKIDQAIVYIKKFIPICNGKIILSERQRDYLLEILGDKENE